MRAPRRGAAFTALLLLVCAVACAPTAPAPSSSAPGAASPPAGASSSAASALAASAPAAGSTGALPAPPEPIRLRVVHSAIAGSQALLQVALDGGLFARHGLDVELANVSGRSATQALLGGELPIIVSSGVEVVASGLAGGDAVIVTAALNTLDTSIWTRDVPEPAALRGRRIGISQLGDSTDFAARYVARRFGLDPATDLEILQTGQPPERLAALEAGAVDATIIQPPLTIRARKAGLRQLVDIPDLGLEYQHTAVITTRRRLAEEPEPIERFVRAWAEAVYYYQANPEQARAAVGRFMRLDDAEALEETYAHYRRLYTRPPYPTLRGLQSILDTLADEDPRARTVPPESFVDTRFLDRLEASGQFRAWEQQYPPAPQ